MSSICTRVGTNDDTLDRGILEVAVPFVFVSSAAPDLVVEFSLSGGRIESITMGVAEINADVCFGLGLTLMTLLHNLHSRKFVLLIRSRIIHKISCALEKFRSRNEKG